jgi:hypothetical protein
MYTYVQCQLNSSIQLTSNSETNVATEIGIETVATEDDPGLLVIVHGAITK